MNRDPFFQEIFHESPVPTIILQADAPGFTIIEVNDAFLHLNRRSRGELLGKGFFECYLHSAIPGKNLDEIKETLSQVVREKKLIRGQIQQFSPPTDGAESCVARYLQATNKPVLDNNGDIKYIICSIKDVTETVTAQIKEHEVNRVIRENERFLRDAQRVARIGSWEIDKERNVKWAEIHHEIFETEEGFVPTIENSFVFLKSKRDSERLEGIFNEGSAMGKSFDDEIEIVTAKGNPRWLRITGKGEVRDGELMRLYGIAQDITSQKNLEIQLTESRNHFESLIHTIQGVVYEATVEDLEITFMSEKVYDILGYTKEEVLSEPEFWRSHLHPEDKGEVISQTFAQIMACNPFSFQYRMRRNDGSYAWVLDSFSVYCLDGQPKQLRGLLIDVTATKLLTDLEHLEKTVLELHSSSNVPLDEVLEYYVKGIEELFPQMACAVMKVEHGHVHNWVSFSLPPAYEAMIENQPIGEKAGSCGTAAFRKEMVIVSDIANDPLWEPYKEDALKVGLRACWSYPIVSSEGEVLATLAMYYGSVNEPTEEELRVVERTASILRVIIEHSYNKELLEESSFLMKQSQELANFGNLQWDIVTDKLTWSNELYVIFGIDPNTKITQERHFELVHPDDRERARKEVAKLLTSKQDQIFEERVVRPSGEVRCLKSWLRVKTDDNGLPVKMIGACLDITESKESEQKLIASEERLRNILDSQTNYVIRIGLDSKYKYINKKFAEDFAFDDQEDLIGLESLRTVREEQKEQVKQVIQECIAHPGRMLSIEMEKLSPRFPNKATFWHFICLTDSNGNPHEIQGIGIDISDRKKAEEERMQKTLELEASERRYSDLFHLSPQPMYLFDTETLRFLDVNAAAIEQYGYSREEFLSITVFDIRPEEKIPELLDELESIKKNNINFYRGIYKQKTKEGEILHVDLHSKLIPFEGKMARLVLAGNITDRVKYLERLKVQNSKLREIAWTQSHVVRAPLARIMALIDMIKNYPELNEENEELLSYIFTSAVELDDVIREISRKAEEVNPDDIEDIN